MRIPTTSAASPTTYQLSQSPVSQSFINTLATQSPANGELLQSDLLPSDSAPQGDELKDAFHDFVGQTFFGEMIKSLRSAQQPSKYFHGGRAEEIFQGQLDQVLTEKLSDATAAQIADPMYELFMMKRSG